MDHLMVLSAPTIDPKPRLMIATHPPALQTKRCKVVSCLQRGFAQIVQFG
jgi:hypothetical protein